MKRGTTPTYTFTLPFSHSNVTKAKVIFSQGEKKVERVIEKPTSSELTVKLTQEETLGFSEGLVEIEIRVLTLGGEAHTSDTMHDSIEDTNDEEVLV